MALPTGMNGGELILDERGCLRVKITADDPGYVPVWPPDFDLDVGNGEVRVLDGGGRVVAEVGEKVVMGGASSGNRRSGRTWTSGRDASCWSVARDPTGSQDRT